MITPPVSVRPATPSDVDVVAALEAETLSVDPWSRGLVAEAVAGDLPTLHVLVAELAADEPGVVVGHAIASLVGDVAELQRLGVWPHTRRRGIATALLTAVVDLARTDGAERLLLEVLDDNPGARAFYAAHGFVEIARRERYYGHDTTALVLELPLAPASGAPGRAR